MENKLNQLISLLSDATKRQLIEWSSTSTVGVYAVRLNSAVYSVSLYQTPSMSLYKLWLDSEDDPICLLDSSQADFASASALQELYNLAQDSAEKRSSTIKASVDELQEMIDRDNLPF